MAVYYKYFDGEDNFCHVSGINSKLLNIVTIAIYAEKIGVTKADVVFELVSSLRRHLVYLSTVNAAGRQSVLKNIERISKRCGADAISLAAYKAQKYNDNGSELLRLLIAIQETEDFVYNLAFKY